MGEEDEKLNCTFMLAGGIAATVTTGAGAAVTDSGALSNPAKSLSILHTSALRMFS